MVQKEEKEEKKFIGERLVEFGDKTTKAGKNSAARFSIPAFLFLLGLVTFPFGIIFMSIGLLVFIGSFGSDEKAK